MKSYFWGGLAGNLVAFVLSKDLNNTEIEQLTDDINQFEKRLIFEEQLISETCSKNREK